ncbi:hypothetical protein [Absidia glauca]|uniref:SAC domain-containing protein n=1 Tax=Absidia glauca TaxID=4829 RepID=A0A168RPD8_ABSGL|nr:hypothetical protein [Absidia glauca]
MGKVYEKLRLTVTKTNYIFTPLFEPANSDAQEPIQTLTVDRIKRQVELNGMVRRKSSSPSILRCSPSIIIGAIEPNVPILSELVVYGILGFCQLQAGNGIFRGTTFQILPMGGESNWAKSFDDLFEQEQYFIGLLESHLQLNTFYFSYTYLLTNNLQRQSQEIDDRFFWNKYLSSKLTAAASDGVTGNEGIKAFVLPVIQGHVSITSMTIGNNLVTFALISRRGRGRAGTRYFSRGIDEHGQVSNYVETEQLVIFGNGDSTIRSDPPAGKLVKLSFIQTRGSIPIFWGQIPNTRYVPQLWYDPEISTQNLQAAKKHFDDQLRHYGPNVLINLINKNGYEQPLGDIYARAVQDLLNPHLRYIHFDFHHECKNLQWHRVQLLIDRLVPDLEKAGYYHCCYDDNDNETTLRSQTGVIRTNCIDCLDRTNVVQSKLAKWMIERWQQDLGINLMENPTFTSVFNSAWVDNADGLSLSYSGTGALKTDYTRDGKRTVKGALNDLNNSIWRYIKNNYWDGSRQDGFDLFLGKYTRDTTPPHRIRCDYDQISRYAPWKIQAVPPALVSSTFLFFWLLFFSDSTPIESSTLYVLLLSVCFAVSVSTWFFIQQNGAEFIDWPKLNPIYADTSLGSYPSGNDVELPNLLSTNWFFDSSENLDQAEQGKKTT